MNDNKPEMILSTIPFSGFYESIHNAAIDDAVEGLFQDNDGDSEVPEAFWDRWEAKPVVEAFAKLYTETLKDKLSEDFDADLSSMIFSDLYSPKEYNFETDVISVEISVEQVRALYLATDKEDLRVLIKDRFTSRSGFSSHYSNSLTEWLGTDMSKWDRNQVGTLIEAYTDNLNLNLQDENKNDAISELVYENMSDKCKALADKFFELNDKDNTKPAIWSDDAPTI